MSAWQVKEELHVEVFPRIALRSIFTEEYLRQHYWPSKG
jgi:hypothetical protein